MSEEPLAAFRQVPRTGVIVDTTEALPVESAARYVDDVNLDPIVLFGGLTKNWHSPGWRMTWTIGPQQVTDAVSCAGIFLDGGGNKPMQRAAIPLLELGAVVHETKALHMVFQHYVKFSFGPSIEVLQTALARLEKLVSTSMRA
jgi:hypothetical protein